MRKLLHIGYYIFSGILLLLATAFCMIEGRLLFSGDWSIYEYAFQGGIQYFCRLLLAVFALGMGFLSFVNIIKQRKKISDLLRTGAVALVIMSAIICFFAINYVGEILLVISVIYFLLSLFKEK